MENALLEAKMVMEVASDRTRMVVVFVGRQVVFSFQLYNL
jgi:hypothetical protein